MLDGAIDATTRLYRNDVARAAFVSHGDTSVAGYDDETGDELKTCLEDAADSISRGATLPVGWGTPISVRCRRSGGCWPASPSRRARRSDSTSSSVQRTIGARERWARTRERDGSQQ